MIFVFVDLLFRAAKVAKEMTEVKENDAYEEELLDYEEEDEKAPDSVGVKVNGESVKK